MDPEPLPSRAEERAKVEEATSSPSRLDRLVESVAHDIGPRSVLAVGPGDSSLAEALSARGIDATAAERLDAVPARSFDLVVCIAALDQLPPAERDAAVATICRLSADVVISPLTPANGGEVRWPEVIARFADQGYEDRSAGLPAGTLRLRRTGPPLAQLVAEQAEEIARLRARVDRLVAALSETEGVVVDTQRRLVEAERIAADLWGVADSTTYRAAQAVRRGVNRALPPGTRRGRLALVGAHGLVLLGEQGPRAVAHRLRERMRTRALTTPNLSSDHAPAWLIDHDQEEYERWLAGSAPTAAELDRLRELGRQLAVRPLVSVVMPAYNSEETWLREAIASVREQTYEHWELCIAEDASPDPRVRTILEEEAAADPRVKVVFRERNGGIAEASNSALAMAGGEWIGFLDHDDLLQPHALHRMVELINAEPDVDLIYSDEDKLSPDGRRVVPFFKPDWSPDLLSSINYINHFTVIRADAVRRAGGFRSGFDGSQDHDLLLRVTDAGDVRVAHVADILYTWRMVPGSAAMDADAKPAAAAARRRAVEEAMQRRGVDARVEPGYHAGWYNVRYALRDHPIVSVVIPTRDRVDLLRRCIDSIRRVSTYPHLRIVVVDNDSRDPATLDYLRSPDLTVIAHPGNFNYAAILNHAVADLKAHPGEHLLFLNNDMEATVPGWIEAMLEQSQRPEVGAVGCRLVYPDGRPQHEGVAIGIGGTANNVDLGSYFGLGRAIRDVGAVTGAALMMRRSTFEEIGGYDEELRVAFNDVDLCMRLRRAGYRIVYTPLAQLIHYESASRGRIHPMEDEEQFALRWGKGETLRDPYVNPNILWYSPLRLRPHRPLDAV